MSQQKAFIDALREHEASFGLELSAEQRERFAAHYLMVLEHNDLLHLVAPTSPAEFAIRHTLESLALCRHLPKNSAFVDVGTGAGFPGIPCLLYREDLTGTLIESKAKKAEFLNESCKQLGIADRSQIINKQFEEYTKVEAPYLTTRALDKLADKLPRLLKWARGKQMFIFSGPNVLQRLEDSGVRAKSELLPLSERRYLIGVDLRAGSKLP